MNLNINSKLLSTSAVKVLNQNIGLILEAHGNASGFIRLKDKHLGCVVFSRGRNYLPEVESYLAYSDDSMIVDESSSNVDISFLTQDGVFNYVIEKTAINDVLCFELNKKKFTLSQQNVTVE